MKPACFGYLKAVLRIAHQLIRNCECFSYCIFFYFFLSGFVPILGFGSLRWFNYFLTPEMNSPVPGEFPAQRPVTRNFELPLICVWINGWLNNREAGDWRRDRAHYYVTVMLLCFPCDFSSLTADQKNYKPTRIDQLSHLPWTKLPPFHRRHF